MFLLHLCDLLQQLSIKGVDINFRNMGFTWPWVGNILDLYFVRSSDKRRYNLTEAAQQDLPLSKGMTCTSSLMS